jgi:hypothetical protein
LHLVDKPVVLGVKLIERVLCSLFVGGKVLLLSLELAEEVLVVFDGLELAFVELIERILLFSDLEVEGDEFSLVG